MQEIWKRAVYNGIHYAAYEVSNLGRVRRAIGGSGAVAGKILKTSEPGSKRKRLYKSLTLTCNGLDKDCDLHRLIACTFIPNPGNLPEVNHIDLNKMNNSIDNLEWCTRKQNAQHAVKNGAWSIGDKHYYRLRPETVPRGDKHLSRLHPECLARGEKNGKYTHPEMILRGEDVPNSKLTEADVRSIKSLLESKSIKQNEIAKLFAVTPTLITQIKFGRAWRHVI